MLRTGAAVHVLPGNQAAADVKPGYGDARGILRNFRGIPLRSNGQPANGSCGADFRAAVAVVQTILGGKIHPGLHEPFQPKLQIGGLEHMGRAVGNAHLAAGANIQKTFQGTGSGRKNALGGVQPLGGVAPASGKSRRSQAGRRSPQELAAGAPGNEGNRGRRSGSGRRSGFFLPGGNQAAGFGKPAVAYPPLAARTHAVIACYAAGGVYFVFLEVQALGLA